MIPVPIAITVNWNRDQNRGNWRGDGRHARVWQTVRGMVRVRKSYPMERDGRWELNDGSERLDMAVRSGCGNLIKIASIIKYLGKIQIVKK